MVSEYGLERRVTCTGDVADIKAAFAALDITVLPGTLPEPFGGVVVESMAMGKPVIGTRVGGTVEQIEDGVTGILVEPNDPQGLAEAMETLLTDDRLRSEMGTQAKARFLRLFEFEPFYLRMSKLYAELVRSESQDADQCRESS
jgi:glycosyltransferase involved in cell wall biosynthesis